MFSNICTYTIIMNTLTIGWEDTTTYKWQTENKVNELIKECSNQLTNAAWNSIVDFRYRASRKYLHWIDYTPNL